MVSGVTIVATCASSRRPSAARSQAPSVVVREPQTLALQLDLQHAVLFA
jgi:hypothetical protein